MAGTCSARIGRLAAVAAADRIKLLLEIVDGDDFLHEILSTAQQTVEGSMAGLSLLSSGHGVDVPQRAGVTVASVLDNNHQESKKNLHNGLWGDRHRLN
jgi:hypothetical protein